MSITKKKQIKEEIPLAQRRRVDRKFGPDAETAAKDNRPLAVAPSDLDDKELAYARKKTTKKATSAVQALIDKRVKQSMDAAAAQADADVQNVAPDLDLQRLAFKALEKEYLKIYNNVRDNVQTGAPGALRGNSLVSISDKDIFNIVDEKFAKAFAGATLVKTDNGFQWVFDDTSTTPVNVYNYEVPVYDTMGNDLTGQGKDQMVNPYMESIKRNNQLILENHRKNRKVHPAAKNNWWYNA